MKKLVQLLVMPSLVLSLFACGQQPLDKKYTSTTMWYDIRVGSTPKNDSLNHELCSQAVAENAKHGIKNEGFTYQELIDQGYELLAKARSKAYADSLREVHK
ncbi:hypothetical protein GO755_24135 [Spirosoma sp. HMF4905]|uniref:Lipoprotein n=1 Tax=Spirosoma arboris TaxID=2682092 RepID=A0A7K1SH67_9BACT|nr:hypothetical protein [Spirosoma arboris]MVM33152.1 hypothetical protein [Spirosoma arboris]